MSFLQELMDKMITIDPRTAFDMMADNELTKEDTVVGKMSDDSAKLFGLFRQIVEEEMNPRIDEIQGLDKESDRYKELNQELTLLKLRIETMRDLFWASLRLDFPELVDKCTIGCRKGGQVYYGACNHNHAIGIDIITVGPGSLADALFG